jgi:hypothetical protein
MTKHGKPRGISRKDLQRVHEMTTRHMSSESWTNTSRGNGLRKRNRNSRRTPSSNVLP